MHTASRFCLYGKPFEDLERGEGVSKKPLSIDQQVVTDEKGRRRFHGAFTGGFSAGYFNTVDTKEGWVPSTFKSSRSVRGERKEQKPEEFMDNEDFSEYGIAPREIKTRDQFSDSADLGKRMGDRQTLGLTSSGLLAESELLEDLIKPVQQSFGSKLLISMGWRPGRGIGPKVERRVRSTEAVAYGCPLPPELQMTEKDADVQNTPAAAAVSAEDFQGFFFDFKTNLHGLGYEGLRAYDGVLRESETSKSTGIPGIKTGKGISGQAFGVGVFEDDDADVYQTDDLSKYTFLPDKLAIQDSERSDSTLEEMVPSKRKGFNRPRFAEHVVPANFVSKFSKETQPVDSDKVVVHSLPPTRTPEQRRVAFSESNSIFDLLSETDRRRLLKIKSENEASAEVVDQAVPEEGPSERNYGTVFKHDPDKQSRFSQFIDHVRREYIMPCPSGMSEHSWRVELVEFVQMLTDNLRQSYEMSKRKSKPMASSGEVTKAFAERLKSKFVKSNTDSDDISKAEVLNEQEEMVRLGMLGPLTRQKWPWHPDRHLCKRFNVPNPYPDSHIVGVPLLRRSEDHVFPFGCETTTTTLKHLSDERETDVKRNVSGHLFKPTHAERDAKSLQEVVRHRNEMEIEEMKKEEEEEIVEEYKRPPIDLFKVVFEPSDDEE